MSQAGQRIISQARLIAAADGHDVTVAEQALGWVVRRAAANKRFASTTSLGNPSELEIGRLPQLRDPLNLTRQGPQLILQTLAMAGKPSGVPVAVALDQPIRALLAVRHARHGYSWIRPSIGANGNVDRSATRYGYLAAVSCLIGPASS
jgi:hypothetical protein